MSGSYIYDVVWCGLEMIENKQKQKFQLQFSVVPRDHLVQVARSGYGGRVRDPRAGIRMNKGNSQFINSRLVLIKST